MKAESFFRVQIYVTSYQLFVATLLSVYIVRRLPAQFVDLESGSLDISHRNENVIYNNIDICTCQHAGSLDLIQVLLELQAHPVFTMLRC